MAKRPASTSKGQYPCHPAKTPAAPTQFRDRKISSVKPESLVPTDAMPTRLHHKMAGGS